jgi:ribosomal protein L21E
MVTGKNIRQHGKIRLSEYFKKFKENDSVCIVREASVKSAFPKTLVGRSGKIISPRGKFYLVRINDQNKEKVYIVHPIHLKLLNEHNKK